ncbi:MAG: 4a-hydroxytetrahydrobiopterin dehydratase [Anaerolineales bacterium]
MSRLAETRCVPCRGGVPPLTADEIAALLPEVPAWQVVAQEDIPRLQRVFRFKDFLAALEFTQKVGALAEEQDHHPRIITEWGRVTVQWWTHKIRGLHHNDFVMAARTDALWEDR